jgi:glycosyltransferase involved in cell wall biosynthesis
MDNYIFIGKYCLDENFKTAGGKRVLNQIKFIQNKVDVFILTFASKGSNLKNHVNFKIKDDRGVFFLLNLIFYSLRIVRILLKRKRKNIKSYLILESKVELVTLIPILFAKLFGYKIIHDIIEDIFSELEISKNQKRTLKLNNFFYKNLSLYCDGIIVISENLLKKFKSYDLPIIKLYNSVEIIHTNFHKDINSKEFRFFYSGTFSEKDGVLDLIDAFNIVSRNKTNLKLNLIGKGKGVYFEKCLNAINHSSNINYLGYVSEEIMFFELINSHVLCVTRSNSEFANNGFPFKLSEYMSFGLPIISTSVSDIPYILTDNENIFLAPPGSSYLIADKMDFVILNYEYALIVGRKGKKYCEDNFSINNIGSQFYQFVKSI